MTATASCGRCGRKLRVTGADASPQGELRQARYAMAVTCKYNADNRTGCLIAKEDAITEKRQRVIA